MRPAGQRQRLVLGGPPGQPDQDAEHLRPDQSQRRTHLQLLDILGQVAAGHAPVDQLADLVGRGEGVELLDPGLDVVLGDPFPGRDRVEVDGVEAGLDNLAVRGHRAVRGADAEVLLGAEHREPEPALEHHLVLRAEQGRHRRRGVAPRQDVRNGGLGRSGRRGGHPAILPHRGAGPANARCSAAVNKKLASIT